MRCRDVHRWVTAYVDGELDEGRASAMRGHARTCPSCRKVIDDELAIRDAAASLQPLDPPDALWAGIQQRLATEEIADARRSRLWLWWQGARRHALAGTVLAAAAAAVVVWQVRGDRGDGDAQVARHGGTPAPAVRPPPIPVQTVAQRRRAELSDADARYRAAIAELEAAVAEERAAWPAEYAARVDARARELAAAVAAERQRLVTEEIADTLDPRERDALYGAYRAQIAFLEQVVVEGQWL